MDFWSYFRVFVIIFLTGALGGAIAFLGNQLGRYIGRKKMSIFKLRPRYTSMLFTILTGMMIASVTLILALVFSEPVRITLLNPKEHERRVNDLEHKIAQLRQLQKTDLVYKKQDIILSAVVVADKNIDKMESALKEVISESNKAAIQKSLDIAKEKGETYAEPTGGRLVGYIPENLNSVARELSRLQGKYVIFARAQTHASLGQTFFVELGSPQPDKLVFRKGELVMEATISGNQDYFKIYDNLLKYVKEDITQLALYRGLFPDPEDKTVGEVDINKLQQVAKAIHQKGGVVRVGYYASNNTYVRGPLILELKVFKK
jgi:hypothetical protein